MICPQQYRSPSPPPPPPPPPPVYHHNPPYSVEYSEPRGIPSSGRPKGVTTITTMVISNLNTTVSKNDIFVSEQSFLTTHDTSAVHTFTLISLCLTGTVQCCWSSGYRHYCCSWSCRGHLSIQGRCLGSIQEVQPAKP